MDATFMRKVPQVTEILSCVDYCSYFVGIYMLMSFVYLYLL